MIKPKYGFLQTVYFIEKGKVEQITIEDMTYAKDGEYGDLDGKKGICYIQGNWIIHENDCYPTKIEALQAQIKKIQQEIIRESVDQKNTPGQNQGALSVQE